MKRNHLSAFAVGSATIAGSVAGLVAPGCESLVRDPRAFFADNPCNVFNCDTLPFLDGDGTPAPDEQNALEPDAISP